MFFYENLEETMKHFSESGGFLSVNGGGSLNTMTVSWGFAGFMWNKPHFVTVVRPQRYTEELLKKANSFTISVPFDGLKKELAECGSKSGRDVEKSEIVRFIPSKSVESPIVGGCDMYYECKIKYIDHFDGDLLSESIKSNFYKSDFHNIYIGEIVECYTK